MGRDSTAVVELIKNAYDADAQHVTVHGEGLQSNGYIAISDDGHGMTEGDFREKFLRIAGRSKEGGDRRSPRFKRRFTGAKGIGRLSAHKLGAGLRLSSVPDSGVLGRRTMDEGFTAYIDWQAIEDSDETIENARNISVTSGGSQTAGLNAGTALTISRLHGRWTVAQLNRFLAEVRSTRPDPALVAAVPTRLFPGEHLFDSISIADSAGKDPGFSIDLSGDFAGSESQWVDLVAQMNWMIEIIAGPDTVMYQITPSAKTVRFNPTARIQIFTDRVAGAHRPEFRSRIFVRDGSTPGTALKGTLDTFAKSVAGVRVFSEGFRVLPYGGVRNDWLGIDADYTQRAAIDVPEDQLARPSGKDFNERVYVRPGSAYFGGVFLHDATSHGLEMVVNREGFLPNESFEAVQRLVRKGVELSVRVRAAVAQAASDERARENVERTRHVRDELLGKASSSESSESAGGSGQSIPATPTERLIQYSKVGVSALQELATSGLKESKEVREAVRVVQAVLEEVNSTVDAAREEQSQIRVLASIGTQMGAFIHEINGILGQARTIRELLDKMLVNPGPSMAGPLRDVRRAQDALITSLERQAIYLSDSLGAEARRRRARQRVKDRIGTAFRLLGPAAATRGVELLDHSDPSARTLPMFPAELNVVLTNLVSNAVKAASTRGEHSGRVEIMTEVREEQLGIIVLNTGVTVELVDSERWFRPFESTTSEIDSVLGQGLGLGLPLTRRIVEEYGGTVAFISPPPGMSTAVEVLLPNR